MVRLQPQDSTLFETYMVSLKSRYAKSIAAAWEVSMEEAMKFAEVQLSTLLPEGLNTRHHALRKVVVDHREAGTVWFSHQPDSIAYVYDIFIKPEFRRQGVASALLEKIEKFGLTHGCFAISLHVFEDNVEAHALYKKSGLKTVGTQLYKRI